MTLLPHEKQIKEYEETLAQLEGPTEGESLLSSADKRRLKKKLERLKERVYSKLTPTERLAICRHTQRPKSLDYIRVLAPDFQELCGDRLFRDDPAIVGGLGLIDGRRFMIIAQEKGSDTDSRLHRNFGMCHPEGFRKALRLMELAGKFGLPILCLVDTQGAYPGLTAEERGQAWAIANNLKEMIRIPAPIIVAIIGEAGSGGALAIAVGDRIGMMEHGYYSVISPEGCASILWKDAAKKGDAAAALKCNSEHLLSFEVIDEIIKEPLGGAHQDATLAIDNVRLFIEKSWLELSGKPLDELLAERYERYRKMGNYRTA